MRNRELTEDLCSRSCRCLHDCARTETSIRSPGEERARVQARCIELWKLQQNDEEDKNMGSNRAAELWITEGHAERFAHVYREGVCLLDLYERIMKSD